MSKGWRRGDCQKGYWNGDHKGKGKEADPNLQWRNGRRKMETLYSLINK
jgi:hypothetical protein